MSIYEEENHASIYFRDRGIAPYLDYIEELKKPWKDSEKFDVTRLRDKLLVKEPFDKEKINVTVEGILFPCALLSVGWFDKKVEQRGFASIPKWKDGLQKWLFNGFDLWAPSWDYSWSSKNSFYEIEKPLFVAQLGEGDEANSIPVMIPYEKGKRLLNEVFKENNAVKAQVSGTLGHRKLFVKEGTPFAEAQGLLDYCIRLNEEEENHKIEICKDSPNFYSGYLWQCFIPKDLYKENMPLQLNDVYFIWEHTNFVDNDTINYNLDSLDHKLEYLKNIYGDMILLQKSSHLVNGDTLWTTEDFYKLFISKGTKQF